MLHICVRKLIRIKATDGRPVASYLRCCCSFPNARLTFLDKSGDDDDGDDNDDDDDGELFSNMDLKICQSLVFHKGVSAKCHSEKKICK